MPKPSLSHDQVVERLRKHARAYDAKTVAAAFVATLGEGDLAQRPLLVAYALASHLPAHSFADEMSGHCGICGAKKTNALAENSGEHGTILPGDPMAALAVLDAWSGRRLATPTPADDEVLAKILQLVPTLPASAGEGKLNDAIRAARLVRGNKYVRRFVIESLGYAGLLSTAEHAGLLIAWSSFRARQARPNARVETDPPVSFWRARDGVNRAALEAHFPRVAARLPLNLASPVKSAEPRTVAPRGAAAYAEGDAFALRLRTRWVVAFDVIAVDGKDLVVRFREGATQDWPPIAGTFKTSKRKELVLVLDHAPAPTSTEGKKRLRSIDPIRPAPTKPLPKSSSFMELEYRLPALLGFPGIR
jgi:hypothetical protein